MQTERHRVVIVGGGFGGLYTAKSLTDTRFEVTLVDRRNHHLFQPLLYQVATGGLSPGDISSPLRAVVARQVNVEVLLGEAHGVDVVHRRLVLRDGEVAYDSIVLATGGRHSYFGNEQWERDAPGLKTVEDALDIRSRVLLAFEKAELEVDAASRERLLTFVIIGGGPTGVELAGALAELARETLKRDFRRIHPHQETRIHLVEAQERILPSYPASLSARARRALERLDVTVTCNTLVTDIDRTRVKLRNDDGARETTLESGTVLWAAGVSASPLGRALAASDGVELDRVGRVVVNPDLTVPGHPEIFVIGDLAHCRQPGGETLPGVAPVAMQQGRYVAETLAARAAGRHPGPFRYRDKGSLAVIGRHAAVAHIGRWRFSGYPAWLAWIFIHIWYLIEFDNKLMVMIQWAFDYFTRKRGARLITGGRRPPLADDSTRRAP